MKKLIIFLTILSFNLLPLRNVHADLSQVSIRRFLFLSSAAACAINIEILSTTNNQLTGNEALLLNGQVFALFTAAIIAAGLVPGDFVLFASPSFQAEAGITPDVMITDQQCQDLQVGDEFTFRGSDGASVVSMASLAITTLPVLNALVFNFSTNEYGLFDLTQFFLGINSLTAFVVVGNQNGQPAEQADLDENGCALHKNYTGRSQMTLPYLLFGLLALASSRRLFNRK